MSIPPFGTAPATLNNIPKMGSVLRAQGYSLINLMAGNMSSSSPGTAISKFSSNARNGYSSRVNEVSPVSTSLIRMVYSSWTGTANPLFQVPNNNDILVKASVQDSSATNTYPVTFGGQRLLRLMSGEPIVSDPLAVPITASTSYNVLTFAGVTNATWNIPTVYTVAGSTNIQAGSTNGCGPGDLTDQNFANFGSGSTGAYAHSAIMGFTGANPIKTLGLLGDSIMAGTGDTGGIYDATGSGWGMRIALQQFGLNVQYPACGPAVYPPVYCARGAGTVANFLAAGQNRGSLLLLSLATTVISNFGINDLGGGVAALKANTLTLAGLIVKQNQKFIAATITPQSTSTNGWIDTANQTPQNLANRASYNDWIRDTSASGFVAQAVAATGYPSSFFGTFDAAAPVETNAAGVITQDGGYWRPPSSGVLFSGTVTTGGTNGFTDTSQTATLNTYRGYAIKWLTGANANSVVGVKYQSAAGVYITSGLTASIGDTYAIYRDIGTIDGTHPTAYSHIAIAQSFPTSLIAIM